MKEKKSLNILCTIYTHIIFGATKTGGLSSAVVEVAVAFVCALVQGA